MPEIDPQTLFRGVVIVAAPHMDDGVLGCGATISALPHKRLVHFVYATDGSRSPVPSFPWQGRASSELPSIRRQEAKEALGVLGIPVENIHFLGLPDGSLSRNGDRLRQLFNELLDRLEPAHLLIPFRRDRHPDHLALNRAVIDLLRLRSPRPSVAEYFVYYRWRLLPSGDIRSFIQSELLTRQVSSEAARRKREALSCFKSQTTLFFAWQHRPVLTERSLKEVCTGPEVFLPVEGSDEGTAIFGRWRMWIVLVHLIEPRVKKAKDLVLDLLRRSWTRHGSGAA